VAAWPAIARGRDALVAAPTGSGKTLAAFLFCLDRLVRAAASGAPAEGTRVVYVSPLRALSNDVQKNLERPAAEIAALAAARGEPIAPIRVSVRTGDTSAKDRRAAVKKPPHVLVTTPESLFVLLGSRSGRRGLEGVDTIILDEIHALAGDKRGAHLSLSVERLEDLVMRAGGARPQRIGLSATVRPMDVTARLLVGASRDLPEIVDVGLRRDLDLEVLVPKDELGAVCTHEQWTELYDRIVTLVAAHRQTLVFVDTRRLSERVTHALGERIGEENVAAHHGSLSRARRFAAEQRLKDGSLKVCVATGSLELGIDIGEIDLVCIVGSPRAIGTAIQRVGRAGHVLGATPKGRFFPRTRDQLLECAAIVRAARAGTLDRMSLRDAPLDVLAQQIVAATAMEARGEDELFDLVRRAAPYAELDRAQYDAVVHMLSEGIATRRGRAGALVHRDAVNRRLKGRRGAGLAALTSGGAIPDNANYDVLLQPEATKVGTVDEDWAIEAGGGDVFLLGNNSWRIQRVESGKVWVTDAHGQAPSVPFWLGEGPSRTRELSTELAALREEILENDDGAWLIDACALEPAGAKLAREYVAAARMALGALPSARRIVAERFFDESGGMQLVVHAPFGARINRALGLLMRKRFCRTFDFELQAAATDDGVLLSLGAQHSFPLESVRDLLRPEGLEEVLEQAALQAPIFGTRFRWNAVRALALLRFTGGKKVPAPLMRMRSDDLLASVFPAQQGCQDNHGVGAKIEVPDHPLVFETLRDCLVEWMDAAGARRVLEALARGEIDVVCRETPEPSVLSHELLAANPYAFLDDAPLEERRTRAVSVRRGLPAEVVERVGGLDAELLARIAAEAAPTVRDADELHDLLLDMGALAEADAEAWSIPRAMFDELVASRRVGSLLVAGARRLWFAAERRSIALTVHASAVVEVDAPEPGGGVKVDRDDALVACLRGRVARTGPARADEIALATALDAGDVDVALARLEADGLVLRGRFRPECPRDHVEWIDRRILARVHRATVDSLRRAIEPASAADLLRFYLSWQGVAGARHQGRGGVSRVVEQLSGFELAASAWEEHVLPARVDGYKAAWLDELCLSGEVAWGRFAPRDAGSTPTRAAPIALARRVDLRWLLTPAEGEAAPVEAELSEAARDVLAQLRAGGASFFDELSTTSDRSDAASAGRERGRAAIEEALWELVGAGRITGDGFAGLRALLARSRAETPAPLRIGRFRAAAPPAVAGRWSVLRAPRNDVADAEAALEARAQQLLVRWGVVLREVLAREPRAPAWRDLLRVYRRLEMRGTLRGGRFVSGLVGEQFALPEALDALRAIKRAPKTGAVVELSACDPLNLAGILTPGPRVPARVGGTVRFRDGVHVPSDAADLTEQPPLDAIA
jgi:ATP-dependent Lhr-like helicase